MELLLTMYAWVQGAGPEWLDAVAKVMLAATTITALTPTKKDNVILDAILKVLNLVAGNVLLNKNKDDS